MYFYDVEQYLQYGLPAIALIVVWKLYQGRVNSLIKENEQLKKEQHQTYLDIMDGYRTTIANCNNLMESCRGVLEEVRLFLKAKLESDLKK